ncbi:penicillin-binding protein PBP2B [Streptococcus sp. 20-1249]|uniref:penicillin-binding protein PBP2B n=1 Tax=Streptococcus hepaticus TaxID=3349163 RepID=UPI003749384E
MAKKKTANNKLRNHIPRRLYILFSLVVLLFTALIARLAYMQIVNQEFYTNKLAKASKKTITTSSVRGQIYDAKGVALVENEVEQVVAFTRSNTMTAGQIKQIAQNLLGYVTVTSVSNSDRDRADYYLADPETYREVVANLPKKKKFDTDGNYLNESTIYANAVASLKPEQLNFSEEENKVIELFSQMNAAGYFETVHLVTEPLTAEQIALIAANEKNLSGISTTSNWNRVVKETSLASIIGTVTTEQAGLPQEDAAEYLAKGYALNDRVGTAYLEKQYEEVLQGKHQVRDILLDKNGRVDQIKTVQEGQKGNNIKLTLDLKFQDGVNAILKKHFDAELSTGSARYSNGVYAVVLKPDTGDVLAMAGYKHDTETNEVSEDALGTITNIFVPGSIVKGATIASGWENGIISGNQVLTDQPIQFAGSNPITSWFTAYGNQDITAVQALQYSSNTYMVQLALKMAGQPYIYGMTLAENDQMTEAMKKLRSTFREFGLGTSTGIDLPLESTGYIPEEFSISNYLTNAFGQFDNYTPLQMAQYAATVANDGKRVSPHLVQGVYDNKEDGSLGNQISTVTGKELNQVNVSAEDMALIKEGFYQVVNGASGFTTGRAIANGASVQISAKTGTAETFVKAADGQFLDAVNTNIVAYAPSDNPQIAVSVVLPNLTDLNSATSKAIVTEIVNLYNSLYHMN